MREPCMLSVAPSTVRAKLDDTLPGLERVCGQGMSSCLSRIPLARCETCCTAFGASGTGIWSDRVAGDVSGSRVTPVMEQALRSTHLKHDVRRCVPPIRRLEVPRQACGFAVRADVHVVGNAVDAMEARPDDI